MNRAIIDEKLNRIANLLGLTRKQVGFTILAIIVILALGIIYSTTFTAPDGNATQENFTVGTNDDSREVANNLEEQGFVKSSLAFRIAFSGPSGAISKCVDCIQSGVYRISKSMNAWDIASILKKEPNMRWVTIPEGLRKEEIADILAGTFKWSGDDKQKWITTYTAMKYDYIEGVYFPDTYLIPIDETPLEMADRLRAHFEEKFAPYAKESLNQNQIEK